MNNDKRIAINIDAKLSGKSTKELKDYADQLSRIQAFSKGLDKGALKQIDSSADGFKDNNKQLEQIAKNTRNSFNIQGITAFLRSAKTLVTTLGQLTEKSSAYRENVNLYRVAFGDATEQADLFINKLTEMYGLDESWLTRTVGTFKQLSNAMGLSVEQGTNLSTLMSRMALDISSLYNVNVDRASTVLQSALAGQTRPIRSLTGADITQNTLQNTLDTMGIEKAVSELSFAEKRLLIIISLTQQLSAATNDYGNTIKQPANQTKILSQQWERLTRAVGNVFLPILAEILPYLNAIVMVLTEIIGAVAKFVATLFNFDLEGTGGSVAGMSDAFLDMEESMNGAGESAKKLKSGLRGFDKLNVISTPKASGGGAGGGIDPDIMNAFNDAFGKYESMIEDVTMKATKIRDRIMEWLGFTKVIDEETGKISWKFEKITGGTILGALAIGGGIFLGIKKIFGFFKGISTIKGIAGGLFDKLTGKGSAKGAGSLLDDVSKTGNSASKMNFKLPNFSTILKGIGELALIIGACTAIVVAYGGLAKIPGFKEFIANGVDVMVDTFIGIAKIILPVLGISAISAGLGLLSSIVLPGLGILALIIGATTAIIVAYGGLAKIDGFDEFISSGINIMVKTFEGLSKIIVPVLAIGAVSAGLGLISSVVIPGLGTLALVIAGATAIVSAYGGLAKIPGINDFVNGGIELMCLVFGGIGKVIGSIAGGAIEAISESVGISLENFGTHLSNFMINAEPFFKKSKNIDAEAMDSIKTIAETILVLTKANILDGLTSWFSGGSDFVKFGVDLSKFAPYFKDFAKEIQSVNQTTLDKTKLASETMLVLTKMAEKIPNSGGVLGFFVGENDLSTFSKMLPDFGTNMKNYSNNIKGLDKSVESNSEKIKNAMKHIIEFAEDIPNEGGVAGFFAGENNISTFGKNLKDFGKYFKEYADKIKDISTEKINGVTSSLKSIVDIAKKIKDNGLGKTMSDFGKNLKDSASNIKSFFDNAFTYNKGWDLGTQLGGGIADAVASKLKNKVFPKIKLTDTSNNTTVGNYKISAYAQGGLPPVGQLFVANEKGPELVGHIGGQSFVANQNQMMDLLDKKIGDAGGMNNATFIIQVGSKELARTVLTDLQDMAKSNGKPITIQG